MPPAQVWGRAVKEGSWLCYHCEILGRFGAHVRSSFAAGEAARVDQVGWQYDTDAKSGLLKGGAAAVSESRERSAKCLSGSLSSGGFETGRTPVRRGHGAGLSVRDHRSSLHALQAGLVWVCSVLGRCGLGSFRAFQEALVGRSVKWQCDSSIESSLLRVGQSVGEAALRCQHQPSSQYV